jgi:hypothetical protein
LGVIAPKTTEEMCMSQTGIEFIEAADCETPNSGQSALVAGLNFRLDRAEKRGLTVKRQGKTLGTCRFFRPSQRLPLKHTVFIEEIRLLEDASAAEALSLLLYGTLRSARILGAKTFVMNEPRGRLLESESAHRLPYPATGAQRGNCGFIDRSMLAIHEALPAEDRRALETLHADEIVATVNAWIEEFYRCKWVTLVHERALTREQYVRYLHDIHCFVRQTTQHLARAVELAPDIELRNHFIEHLKGEINHELWIEADLKNLGLDPAYLRESYLPNTATRQFMAMQETLLKFYRDPVIFMACPLVAEGTAAMMTPRFLESLEQCVRSWGVEKPAKAMTFTRSHMITDAGTANRDGHWILTARMIGKYVRSERRLQEFLSFMRGLMDSYRNGVDQSIEDASLWSMEGQVAHEH